MFETKICRVQKRIGNGVQTIGITITLPRIKKHAWVVTLHASQHKASQRLPGVRKRCPFHYRDLISSPELFHMMLFSITTRISC